MTAASPEELTNSDSSVLIQHHSGQPSYAANGPDLGTKTSRPRMSTSQDALPSRDSANQSTLTTRHLVHLHIVLQITMRH